VYGESQCKSPASCGLQSSAGASTYGQSIGGWLLGWPLALQLRGRSHARRWALDFPKHRYGIISPIYNHRHRKTTRSVDRSRAIRECSCSLRKKTMSTSVGTPPKQGQPRAKLSGVGAKSYSVVSMVCSAAQQRAPHCRGTIRCFACPHANLNRLRSYSMRRCTPVFAHTRPPTNNNTSPLQASVWDKQAQLDETQLRAVEVLARAVAQSPLPPHVSVQPLWSSSPVMMECAHGAHVVAIVRSHT